jgi:hypothetical protein
MAILPEEKSIPREETLLSLTADSHQEKFPLPEKLSKKTELVNPEFSVTVDPVPKKLSVVP